MLYDIDSHGREDHDCPDCIEHHDLLYFGERRQATNLSADIAGGIFGAPLDKVGFGLLEGELFCEIVLDEGEIHSVLAGIDIDADEPTGREGMNGNVAFGDHDDAAPAAGVFASVVRGEIDLRIGEL